MKNIILTMTSLVRRDGTACVELALCLPLMVCGFMGALDLSRAYRIQLALQDAVRCGTLLAASTPRSDANPQVWEDRIKDAISARLQATVGGAAPNQCSIEYLASLDSAQIQVTGTVSFKLLVAWPFLPKQFDISNSLFIQRFR